MVQPSKFQIFLEKVSFKCHHRISKVKKHRKIIYNVFDMINKRDHNQLGSIIMNKF
jgi:hypothetical protein